MRHREGHGHTTFGTLGLAGLGQELKFPSCVTCRGRLEGICIAHADGTNLRALVSGDALYGTKWSPDGTRIAYLNQDNGDKVFVVDVATGETTFVAEGALEGWLDDHTLILNAT